jgi:acyl carrier protein
MRLKELFATVLEEPIEKITDQTSPRTLRKWDSLAHVNLISSIEQHYQVRFSMAEITAIRSLAQAREMLCRKGVNA